MGKIQVKNEDDLNDVLNDLYEQNDMLRRAVKASWTNKPFDDLNDTHEKFGRMLKAIAKSDFQTLKDLGVQRGTIPGPDFSGKAALGTPLVSDSTTGSYVVPQQFIGEILRIAEEASELIPRVRRYKMTSRTAKVPKTVNGVSFTYVASQGDDLTEQNPTFGELDLTAYTYALWIGTSEEFVEDQAVNIGAYFAELIQEAYTAIFESELLTGSGSPVTGVLNDTNVNIVTMDEGDTTFDAIEADDLMSLIEALTTRAKRRGAMFIMSPTILDKVIKLKNAQGDYIFREASAGKPATLHGYPYLLSDEMPGSGDDAADTAFLAFGNPRHLVHGDRVDLEIRFFPETRYAVSNAEVFWRARIRKAWTVGLPAGFSILKTAAS